MPSVGGGGGSFENKKQELQTISDMGGPQQPTHNKDNEAKTKVLLKCTAEGKRSRLHGQHQRLNTTVWYEASVLVVVP